jgi:hypothetical protein
LLLTVSFAGVDAEFVQIGKGDEHKSIVGADGCSKSNIIDTSIRLQYNSTYHYKYYYYQSIDRTYEMNYLNKPYVDDRYDDKNSKQMMIVVDLRIHY